MDEIIYSYTRKQAIEDGVLIDVSSIAKDAGFKVNVAITTALYSDYINSSVKHVDERGRLWDVLFLLTVAAKECNDDVLIYDVSFPTENENNSTIPIKAVIGPGDNAEPVVTIMLPYED